MSRKRLGAVMSPLLLSLAAWVIVAGAPAWAAIPNIPPAMLDQLKSMSPAEQAVLARQYGIEIPGLGGGSLEESALGEPGEDIDVFERVQKMQLERELLDDLAEEEGEDLEEELKRFGLDLFDREVSTFAPVDDMPAPDGYRLGPGDSINVYMYGNQDSESTLAVSREGLLMLPSLGPVSVAGLTFDEAKKLIESKVASQLLGTDVIVSIGKMRAMNVFLAGDVFAPGSYSVSSLATVLQVLFAGGGLTEIGSLRDIQVKRRGEIVGRLDVYNILLKGDTSGDIRLLSGDTVFVPAVGSLVSIDGEVKRPAIYEVSREDTLGDLLKMAGGLTAAGYGKSASIKRRESNQASVGRVQVDLTNETDLARALVDGDSLTVAPIKSEVTNQILLRGAVARPGGYAWSEGIRVSDLLGSLDDDLLSETDLSTGLVIRRTGVGLEIEPLALSLGLALQDPGGDKNLLLQPKDEVLVFALPYLNESYQELVASKSEDLNDVSEDTRQIDFDVELRGDSELDIYAALEQAQKLREEELEEQEKDEILYEDRSSLIEEVVFRLQAQAKSPSSTQIVEISGDVRLPGKYPLLEDRRLDPLIALAGGFESSAFLDSAEITRIDFTPSGSARISTSKVQMGEGAHVGRFELEPLDRVRISRIPNWSYGDTVELSGAVVFPGEYPIVPGEMLSSVIARAGGIADNGFAQGAVLIKVEAQKREQEQLRRLIASIQRNAIAQSQTREERQSGMSSSGDSRDELEFLESVLESEAGGRVIIDLQAIMRSDADADIQLEAGDSLMVPEFNNTVSIIGEVRQPGTFRFESGRSLSDYIDLAAGSTVRADDKETYVVRANGKVERVAARGSIWKFTPGRESFLEPGDTIVVPVNEEYQPVLSRYKEVSTVIFQSVASLYPLFRL